MEFIVRPAGRFAIRTGPKRSGLGGALRETKTSPRLASRRPTATLGPMPSAEELTVLVGWCWQHVTGDEKGESQIFLDRLFQAFGQGGVKEAGATLEMRVAKSDLGGTAFADLVWKPVVLIEMKKRGTDLQKHYRQAFDYWIRLVPHRPRWEAGSLRHAQAVITLGIGRRAGSV